MNTRRCPPGKFYRKTFTRKGRRIMGRCLRKTTKALISSRRRMGVRMRGFRKSRRGARRCRTGKILRAAYVRVTRGRRVPVPASCIPDVGALGKGLRGGPGIGTLRKGNLMRFGYQKIAGMPMTSRRTALRSAVGKYSALTVWRKLNALSVYTRRTSPATSRVAKEDMDWVRATWGIKAF